MVGPFGIQAPSGREGWYVFYYACSIPQRNTIGPNVVIINLYFGYDYELHDCADFYLFHAHKYPTFNISFYLSVCYRKVYIKGSKGKYFKLSIIVSIQLHKQCSYSVFDPVVLQLMDVPPFSSPPKYIRAHLYHYHFTAYNISKPM